MPDWLVSAGHRSGHAPAVHARSKVRALGGTLAPSPLYRVATHPTSVEKLLGMFAVFMERASGVTVCIGYVVVTGQSPVLL